ncbi:MAG: hypothetical protein QM662_10075, partial [Gordonia sp. (in: high G+C Gram-positive bacteria)]
GPFGGGPPGDPPGAPQTVGGGSPFGPPGGSPLPGGAPPASAGVPATTGPPTALLAGAAVCAIGGIVLGAVFWERWIAGIGWFLAGPVAIGVLGLFNATDTARRSAPIYLRPSWVRAVTVVVTLLIVAGVLVTAVSFAFWVGRR